MSIAIERFQSYLKIKTVQPSPDYESCIPFFKSYAEELELAFEVYRIETNPIILLTWNGSNKALPSLLLNSHLDVVPVSQDKWSVPAFDAVIKDNRIYARGAQDMKCVGIGYLEAIRLLKKQGYSPQRTMIVSFVPDEEIGGHLGMERWVLTDHFKSKNIGFALDEGLPHPENAFKVYYGERCPWWFNLKTTGNAGHGSQFIQPNAVIRMHSLLSKFIAFRNAEEQRMALSNLTLGDVTSTNINQLQAGVQANVVPDKCEATVDMRISPFVDLIKLEKELQNWATESHATLEFIQQFKYNQPTKRDAHFWPLLERVATNHQIKLEFEIFPAATDSRYLRQAGVPALGLTPFRHTPVLLHNHDEYLDLDEFLEGINFYRDLIKAWSE